MLDRFKIPDIDVICKRVFQRHADDLEALNKLQLSQGKRSDESNLPKTYAKSYQKIRRKHGRPLSPMDLNLTGDFYSQFYSLYFQKFMELGSKDWKERILEERFGKIHGLTGKNKEDFINSILDELIREFKTEFLEHL